MAALVDLSSAQQSQLIELYRNYAVLWDSTLEGYKNQATRMKALIAMQTQFEARCGVMLEINDLKTKLQSFRSIVSKEMPKLEESTRNGIPEELYVPKSRHWHELQFLRRFIRKRGAKSSLDGEYLQPSPEPIKLEPPSIVWTTQIADTQLSDGPSQPLPDGLPTPVMTIHQQSVASSTCSNSSFEEHPYSAQSPVPSADQQTDYTLQTESRQQASPSSILNAQDKQSKKRKVDNTTDMNMENLGAYLKNKMAKMMPKLAASVIAEDPYMIWAMSLVNELKAITNEKRRKLIQIKINRIVQDEIESEIEKELSESEFGY